MEDLSNDEDRQCEEERGERRRVPREHERRVRLTYFSFSHLNDLLK